MDLQKQAFRELLTVAVIYLINNDNNEMKTRNRDHVRHQENRWQP
jgi:hypothetical protein